MMNIGIIGYGGFGHFLHHAWEQLADVQVISVADPRPMISESSTIVHHANYKELLANPKIDAISIATLPNSHAHIACEAMEAGKHVLIEKPLATTISDAELILATRERTGMVAGIDFMLRFNPIITGIKKIADTNALGSLRRVHLENQAQDELLPPDHWFWDKKISGGIFVEHGVHFFDVTNWLAKSEVVAVEGMSEFRATGQEDRVLASVQYQNGVLATHHHAFTRPGFFENTELILTYDLAEIHLQGWIPLKGSLKALCNDSTESELKKLPGFDIINRQLITDLEDSSRPDGWGQSVSVQHPLTANTVVRGESYRVTAQIEAHLNLGRSKSEAYTDCLTALLRDFVDAINDSNHPIGVGLEAGIESLDVALQADTSAANP